MGELTGVEIKEDDILVSHRLPTSSKYKGGKTVPPITVNSLVSGHPRELKNVTVSRAVRLSRKRTPKKNRVDVRLRES